MTDPTGRDLLDEQMDRRLQEYGARWRGALPQPALTAPASVRPHRRWLVPAAAAAAVLAVGGLTFILASHHGTSRSASPVDRAGAGPCEPGDLRVVGDRDADRGGYHYTYGWIELAGSTPCTIAGYPDAVLRGNGPFSATPERVAPDGPPTSVLVTTSARAVVTVRIALSGLDCLSAEVESVHITLPSGDVGELPGTGGLCDLSGDPIVPQVLPITSEVTSPVDAPPGTVRGKVTMDGGPASGTSIPVTSGQIAFDGESTSAGTSISSDGSYEVKLPPGDYDVSVSTPDWNGGQTYEAVTYRVSGGGTNRLDVRLPIR